MTPSTRTLNLSTLFGTFTLSPASIHPSRDPDPTPSAVRNSIRHEVRPTASHQNTPGRLVGATRNGMDRLGGRRRRCHHHALHDARRVLCVGIHPLSIVRGRGAGGYPLPSMLGRGDNLLSTPASSEMRRWERPQRPWKEPAAAAVTGAFSTSGRGPRLLP